MTKHCTAMLRHPRWALWTSGCTGMLVLFPVGTQAPHERNWIITGLILQPKGQSSTWNIKQSSSSHYCSEHWMTYRNDTSATKQTAGGSLQGSSTLTAACRMWGAAALGPRSESVRCGLWHLREASSALKFFHISITFPPAGASSSSPTAPNQFPPSTPQVYIYHSTRLLQSPHGQWAAQSSSCPMSADLTQDLDPGNACER